MIGDLVRVYKWTRANLTTYGGYQWGLGETRWFSGDGPAGDACRSAESAVEAAVRVPGARVDLDALAAAALLPWEETR